MADYNKIEELAPNMLSDLVNLTTINLTMNQLEKFPLSTLKLSKGKHILLYNTGIKDKNSMILSAIFKNLIFLSSF